MKLSIILFFSCWVSFGNPTDINADPNSVVQEMISEMTAIQKTYNIKFVAIDNQIETINQKLLFETNIENKVNFLIEKDQLRTQLKNLKFHNATDISKIRYIKGLQIIKILYEKVLGLDHHFSSVRTFSEISKMANPNQYPEFEKVNELLKTKKDKKAGFDLTAVLGNNPIVSAVGMLSNMLVSSLSKEEKDTELQKVECILDFTLRMQNDLNTIYFETAYLQSSNETIKTDIETLFKEYTKPIGYATTLKDCRNQDDWDNVQSKLDAYLAETAKATDLQKTKMQINIEFPIDRLIQFVTQYNNFIGDGEKFYQKFNIILSSYENQKQCESKLPLEYDKLKVDINLAIDKFNVAYKPVEINGSKMKEILYGINEFQ